MANRQYVGARYVPKFATPVEWDNVRQYEALTIVTHLGNSFTSKKPVPAGVDIGNAEYWANTGNYNEQIATYQSQVMELSTGVSPLINRAIYADNPGNNLKPVIADGVTDNSDALAAIVNYAQSNNIPVILPHGVIKITKQIEVNSCKIIGAGCYSQNYAGIAEFNGTTILCAEPNACIKVTAGTAGLEISGIHFKGTTAKNFVVIGGAQYSEFNNLSFSGATAEQLSLKTESSIIGWCNFDRLWFYPSDAKCLVLGVNTAFTKNSNVCHNIFNHLAVNHKSVGIEIGDADNNLFIGCYIFGTAENAGVHFINTNGVSPIANIFLHCQAMQGVVFDTGCNYNAIYGYQFDNGEKDPVLNGTTNLIASMYGTIGGVRGLGMQYSPSPLCGSVTLTENSTSAHVTFDYPVKGNYYVFTSVRAGTDVGITVNVANTTSNGFDIYTKNAAPKNVEINYMIIGV